MTDRRRTEEQCSCLQRKQLHCFLSSSESRLDHLCRLVTGKYLEQPEWAIHMDFMENGELLSVSLGESSSIQILISKTSNVNIKTDLDFPLGLRVNIKGIPAVGVKSRIIYSASRGPPLTVGIVRNLSDLGLKSQQFQLDQEEALLNGAERGTIDSVAHSYHQQ